MIDFEKELNKEQLSVVLNGDGYCLVLSGPGSGKTRTLTYRTAYLLEKNTPPERILLLTFTKKAAKEMVDRINMLSSEKGKHIYGGTFHHIANLFLRRHADIVGYQKNFTIIDEDDSKSIFKNIVKEKKSQLSPGLLKNIASLSVNSQKGLYETVACFFSQLEEDFTAIEENVVREYHQQKKERNLMDYDDLLANFLTVVSHPEVGKKISENFLYLLVDEYQDTNLLQNEIIKKISAVHGNVLAVGDDAQSIYSFRAADINNIINFSDNYPGAKIFKIEKNYRSTEEILEAANLVIENNTGRLDKKLQSVIGKGKEPSVIPFSDLQRQAEFVANYIEKSDNRREVAVLFRAHHHAAELELALTRKKISYLVRGGIRFFEQAHIKDTLSFLRIFVNFKDTPSWKKTLSKYEKIGEVTAEKITKKITEHHSLEDLLSNREDLLKSIASQKAKEGLSSLLDIIEDCLHENVSQKINTFLENFYEDYLRLNFENFFKRKSDIEKLQELSATYDSTQQMLSDFALSEDFTATGNNDEKPVLSTIHQAKGLEWDTVFIIGLEEGAFPHARSLEEEMVEEERRLFYVAVTRCRKNLFLTHPLYNYKNRQRNAPSRFLKEIQSIGGFDEEIIEDDREWRFF